MDLDFDNPKFDPENLIKSYSKHGNPVKSTEKTAIIHGDDKAVVNKAVSCTKAEELTTKDAVSYLMAGTLNSKVCRYCLNVTIELFDLEREMEIAHKKGIYSIAVKDMVASFHPFKVSNESNLPNKICDKCLDRTIHAYLFTQQCDQAERAIINCLEDIQTKLQKLDPIGGKKRGRRPLHPNYNKIKVEHTNVIDYAEPIIQIVNTTSEALSAVPGLNPLECLKCSHVFPDALSLANHSQIHPKNMWFNCRLCGNSFPKVYLLRRHIQREHFYPKPKQIDDKKVDVFECKTCGEVNEKYYSHIQHIEKHKFKTVMEHLVHGKMDKLCSVCLDKPEGSLVPLNKSVCIHGGPPDLMGERTMQSILTSTVPELAFVNNYTGTKICEKCVNNAITSYVFKTQTYFVRDRFSTCVSLMVDNLNTIDPTNNLCVEIALNTIMPIKYPVDETIFEIIDEIDATVYEFPVKKEKNDSMAELVEVKQVNEERKVSKKSKIVLNGYQKVCSEFLTFKKKPIENKKFTCPTCNKHFISDYFLKIHFMKHINGTVKCEPCGSVFANKFRLNEHTKFAHILYQSDYRSCKICGRGFAKPEKLENHQKQHSNKQCQLCDKIFKNQQYFDTHMSRHGPKLVTQNKKTCSICEKLFTSNNQLLLHVNKSHLQFKYGCDMCEKQFYTKLNLKFHKKVHSKYSMETCNFCNKVLKSRKLLVLHIRKHIGDTPYNCAACNQSFYSRNKLRKHMNVSHGGTFVCKVCKNVFVSKSDLKVHKNIAHSCM